MKLKLTWLILFGIIQGCNSDSQNKYGENLKDSVSIQEVEESAQTESANKIITLPQQTPAIIATRSWDMPAGDWSKANKQIYSDTVQFDQVKAAVIVSFISLSMDSSYLIKELSIQSYKENKNYVFTGRISDQYNMSTTNAFDTYVMVDITATLKPGYKSTIKLEGKSLVANAKDGKVEPF